MEKKQENKKLFLALYLGILSAFAPFVMDMYLASMPELEQYFSTSVANVQLSLATCVAGLGIGQLFFGAVSDHTGRKLPILVSLLLYLFITVGCLYAPSIYLFVALRFVQGLVASGGVVISRSIVADYYHGVELSRMYGIVGLINGVATLLAPMVGGVITAQWGWKGVFGTLIIVGAIMLLCTFYFHETLSKESRVSVAPKAVGKVMITMLRSRQYLVPCLCYSMMMSLIIVTLSSAPFILDTMGMNEHGISLILGANATVIAITTMGSSRFKNQQAMLRRSAVVIVIGAGIAACALWTRNELFNYEYGVLIIYLGLGGLNTSSVSLSMEAGRTHAGSAAALLGTLGYLVGGLVTVLEGLGNPFVSTPWLFVSLALITFILTRIKR